MDDEAIGGNGDRRDGGAHGQPGHVDARGGQGTQLGDDNLQINQWMVPHTGPVHWPVRVGRPPLRAAAFQQRDVLESRVASGMARGSTAVLTQVVAAGDGGVGKTQLAAALYAKAQADGVDLTVWIDASSRSSIVTGYAQARAATEPDAVAGLRADQAANRFLGWLGGTERSWLVVLDDVADPADVHGLWPSGLHGTVVATTRRRDLAPAGSQQVEVGVFSEEEADGYLRKKLAGTAVNPAHPDVLDEATEMAHDLGRLPVALAQAAAVILNDGITCAAYRRRFEARGLQRLFPPDASADEYGRTVATTWSLAVEQADRLSPTGLARPALRIAALVDPNGAPEALWTTTAILEFLMSEAGNDGAQPDDARSALRNLHRLSLVTHDPRGGNLAVRTHALVQRATLDPLAADELDETVRVAADALLEIWPHIDSDPVLARALRQNATSLTEHVPDALWKGGTTHPLVWRAGKSLGDLGLVEEAVGYWQDAVVTATRVLGPDHNDTLVARGHLARWKGEAGNASAAVTAYEELLKDQIRVVGPDHIDTLIIRHNLAYWKGEAGDPKGAELAFSALLTEFVNVLGADNPSTLTTRHHLAAWQGKSGDASGAAQAFEVLLEDRLRVLDPDHIDVLATRHDLATWRGESGDPAAAATGLEELLDDYLRVLGPDHPHTLTTRANVARWRGELGDSEAAAAAFGELFKDQLRLLGPNHPHTLTTRAHLAWFRGRSGDAAGAMVDLESLLQDRIRVLGPDHPHTQLTRNDIAHWQAIANN